MNEYFQYVHNLKGVTQFERFKPATREAIYSILLRQIDDFNDLEKTIIKETDREVLQFLAQHLDLKSCHRNIILSTGKSSYVEDVGFTRIDAIINLRRVNYTQHINQLFRAVNNLLPNSGLYIGRVETYSNRKETIFRQYGKYLGQIIWLIDFALNRVIPRLRPLEKIYYQVTRGEFHAISDTEILGRLIYCGFEILAMQKINGLYYFVAKKVKEPLKGENPTNYPIVRLTRVGKDGKIIKVYKFRTMHPYSEFLQEYMIKRNGYNDKGKPANDYRVPLWGKYMRKIWLDELPQLINVVKGEMKLVGLRPVSKYRFSEFPEDLQQERIKYKPGCFPPYVALNMPDDKGNIEAERIYIRDLARHPYTTDIKYFGKAVYNILANKIRSS